MQQRRGRGGMRLRGSVRLVELERDRRGDLEGGLEGVDSLAKGSRTLIVIVGCYD